MKKTILALAVALAAGSAFATGVGVAGSTGSTKAGVSTNSSATAASSGNGTAFTTTAGYQFANSTQSNSASVYGNPFLNQTTGGKTSVSGVAETAGGAISYTKTTGTGVAGSLTTGEACADASASGAFLAPNGATGSASGSATSRGANSAGTISVGNGEALRGNDTSNFSTFAAAAQADKKGFTTQLLNATSSASAQSDSTKTVFAPITNGTATGFQTSTNYGNASALSNARVGNVCSGQGC